MQFYSKCLSDSLRGDINYAINVISLSVLWQFAVVMQWNKMLPKSQTKPFYIGTKEAPSERTRAFNA